MTRDELDELHFITPIGNVASILEQGLLSHRNVAKIDHESIAMQEIQGRRSTVTVPGGLALHDYVNLYICGRNPMLYKCARMRGDLCVLAISTDVLDLAGVVVTDSNASSTYVRFAKAPSGLEIVNGSLTFAEYWTDENPIEQFRRKAAKCAEVLVPHCIPPQYVLKGYVADAGTAAALSKLAVHLAVVAEPTLFFR